jgi:hypothetical protein
LTFDPSLSTGLNPLFPLSKLQVHRKSKCGRELKLNIGNNWRTARRIARTKSELLGEIPDPQVLDHALAKRGHNALLSEGSDDHLATPDARHDIRVL